MNDETRVNDSGRRQRWDGTFYMYDERGREVPCAPVFKLISGETWYTPHAGLPRTELFQLEVATGRRTRLI